jgi:hypothetical protein
MLVNVETGIDGVLDGGAGFGHVVVLSANAS